MNVLLLLTQALLSMRAAIRAFPLQNTSRSNRASLTGFSGGHEVDEHVVDARSLAQHQRLGENEQPP